jgi:hypothetical protein
MQRKASAVWKGGLKDGKGTISAPGGVLNNTQYSFTTRFENAPGRIRGVDCSGACGMFFHGAVGAVGRSESDSGKHFDHRHSLARQTGFGMDDYGEPYRRCRQSSRRGCGHLPKVCRGGREGLSSVEGAECEDHDERKARISEPKRIRRGKRSRV